MADFDVAYSRLQKLEGGYANQKDDNGGPTNFGLSSKFLNECKHDGTYIGELDDNKDGIIDAEEIKDIEPEEAKDIFRFYFWLRNHYDKIQSQDLANNLFDFAIHAGSYKANFLLQEAINSYSGNHIKEDGIIGPETIRHANSVSTLLYLYKIKRSAFYMRVANHNPSQKKYLKGWLNRVAD